MNGTFEDKLLGQLKQVVTERAAEPVTRRHWRPRLALAGAVAATAAIGIAAPLLLADKSSPAWAVTTEKNGWVRVAIHDLRDAEGLERKLEDLGIPAEVDFTPVGQACKQPRFTPAEGVGEAVIRVLSELSQPDGSASFLVRPSVFDDGKTLVLETTTGQVQGPMEDARAIGFEAAVAQGPVAPCEVVPAEDRVVVHLDR